MKRLSYFIIIISFIISFISCGISFAEQTNQDPTSTDDNILSASCVEDIVEKYAEALSNIQSKNDIEQINNLRKALFGELSDFQGERNSQYCERSFAFGEFQIIYTFYTTDDGTIRDFIFSKENKISGIYTTLDMNKFGGTDYVSGDLYGNSLGDGYVYDPEWNKPSVSDGVSGDQWQRSYPNRISFNGYNVPLKYYGNNNRITAVSAFIESENMLIMKQKDRIAVADLGTGKVTVFGDVLTGANEEALAIDTGRIYFTDDSFGYITDSGEKVTIKTEEGAELTSADIEKFLAAISDPKLMKEIKNILSIIDGIYAINAEIIKMIGEDFLAFRNELMSGMFKDVMEGRLDLLSDMNAENLKLFMEKIDSFVLGLREKEKIEPTAEGAALLARYDELAKSAGSLAALYERDMRHVRYLFATIREKFGKERSRIIVMKKNNKKEIIVFLKKKVMPKEPLTVTENREDLIRKFSARPNVDMGLVNEMVK